VAAGVTVATLAEAAWGLLLGRYSGRRDVVFGAIGSGRSGDLPKLSEMVGLFVSTLPVRLRWRGGEDLLYWLRELQRDRVAARQYEHVPLTRIRRWSGVQGATPLFDSVLSFQGATLSEALGKAPGELTIRDVAVEEKPGFPLIAVVLADSQRVVLELQYDGRRIRDAESARLLMHLEALLQAMAHGVHRTVAELPVVTAAERHQLQVEWNDTEAPLPEGMALHDLVLRRGLGAPASIALRTPGKAWTFGELLERSRTLAQRLVSVGVRPDHPVGLWAGRSPELAVAVLGILRAGASFLPLDPDLPLQRLRWMLEDSGARCVVRAGDSALPPLPDLPHSPQVIELRLEESEVAGGEQRPLPEVDPEQAAYTLYTSGSTGRPKAAAVSHRSLVAYAVTMARRLGLTAQDVFLQFASPSFDVLVEELFPIWWAGGAGAFHGAGAVVRPRRLERAIRELGATVLELPAGYWHEWVEDLQAAGRRPPSSLRQLLVGAEAPRPDLVASWVGYGIALTHVFGLTETAVTTTVHRIDGADGSSPAADLRAPVPVGGPLVGMRTYVLDPWLQPQPPSVAGELYIAGVGLGRCYHRRPALTAERFLPDPFSTVPGGRLFRTGDRARVRGDGALELSGRLDRQVKVRGVRVEPGEVEARLREQPGVREAAVVAPSDAHGHRRLVAFLVPRGDRSLDLRDLSESLAGSLPQAMLPARYEVLEALPRTASGKVDRQALSSRPEEASRRAAGEGTAPRSRREEAVARAWCKVLGLEAVEVDDHFFEVGGDSLSLIRLSRELEPVFGREISLMELFTHTSVAAQACHLGAPEVGDRVERIGHKVRQRAQLRTAMNRRRRPRIAVS
jgi:amino acid adenylation domain-containing protein